MSEVRQSYDAAAAKSDSTSIYGLSPWQSSVHAWATMVLHRHNQIRRKPDTHFFKQCDLLPRCLDSLTHVHVVFEAQRVLQGAQRPHTITPLQPESAGECSWNQHQAHLINSCHSVCAHRDHIVAVSGMNGLCLSSLPSHSGHSVYAAVLSYLLFPNSSIHIGGKRLCHFLTYAESLNISNPITGTEKGSLRWKYLKYQCFCFLICCVVIFCSWKQRSSLCFKVFQTFVTQHLSEHKCNHRMWSYLPMVQGRSTRRISADSVRRL